MEDIEDLMIPSTRRRRETEKAFPAGEPIRLEDVALIPSTAFSLDNKEDNCAVATRRIERNTHIVFGNTASFRLSHTVLEGHRFAIKQVKKGEKLLSWGMPFAITTQPISPGTYICNDRIVSALRGRGITYALPEANFRDILPEFSLSDAKIAESQIPMLPEKDRRFFHGYARGGNRGVGTRNLIVVISITAQTSAFVQQLTEKLRSRVSGLGVDDIVAVAHTELAEIVGNRGKTRRANNETLVLRTLAGFVVHPNVGGALLVDDERTRGGLELKKFMKRSPYSELLPHCRNAFLTTTGDFCNDLKQGEAKLLPILKSAAASDRRTRQPLSYLSVALQCGGSDAFSGVSGNPIAGAAARELIRHGGIAIQAETDELIGAESFFLRSPGCVKGRAKHFLALVERFKKRLRNHGTSPEANPSGGNNYRGIYNITLKSLGAALKKAPDVRLDEVVEYGERLTRDVGEDTKRRGLFVFMDSPGNDLESISGQVASGASLILFTTGNGSVTNHPLAPTLKLITTTRRYERLKEDMDFNAGALNDGTKSFQRLYEDLFEQLVGVASGSLSKGERKGRSTISIWRDWYHADTKHSEEPLDAEIDDELKASAAGESEFVSKREGESDRTAICVRLDSPMVFPASSTSSRPYAIDAVGLIQPTSLCSGEAARMIADALNGRLRHERTKATSVKSTILGTSFDRFVALPHTEGCGSTGSMFQEILGGTIRNPIVRYCVLLEHGCEKNHNDAMEKHIRSLGLSVESFGFCSIQRGGGVAAAVRRVTDLFEAYVTSFSAAKVPRARIKTSACNIGCGLLVATESGERLDKTTAESFRLFARAVARDWNGKVVVPKTSVLFRHASFLDDSFETDSLCAHVVGKDRTGGGIVVLEDGSDARMTASEVLSLLAACDSVQILVCYCPFAISGHPLLPTVVVRSASDASSPGDADFVLEVPKSSDRNRVDLTVASRNAKGLCDMLCGVASSRVAPKANRFGNVFFQLPRGRGGVSV